MLLVCGRGGIRTPGTLSGTPVFKTGAINQLCHSSWCSLLKRRKSNHYFLIEKLFTIKIKKRQHEAKTRLLKSRLNQSMDIIIIHRVMQDYIRLRLIFLPA